jgi:hypothetical protein
LNLQLSLVSGFQGFIQIGVGVGVAIGIDCLTTEHFFGFMVSGFKVSGFHGFIQIGVGIGIGIGIGIVDPRPATFDPRRSTGTPAFPTPQVAFQGFWFQGFWVSSKSGSVSVSLSESIV